MRYRFPYVGADLRKLVLSQTPAYTATCLFIPQAFAGYSLRLPTEGWLRLSRPGCLSASLSRDVPVYSPSFRWVLTAPTHRGLAQAE